MTSPLPKRNFAQFLERSAILPKVFHSKCKEVTVSRKKLAKEYYFEALAYTHVFMTKRKETKDMFDKIRMEEKKNALH